MRARLRIGVALAASLAALLAHRDARRGYFLMDDWGYVRAGEEIVRGGPEVLGVYATRKFQGLYRPVPDLLNALDAALFGRDARGWLATNVLLHAACAALVGDLALAVSGNAAFALAAGVLFATAPAAGHSADVVSLRVNALAALLALASLRTAFGGRGGRSPPRLLGAALLAVLAVFSKETAAVLPGIAAFLLVQARACGRSVPRPAAVLAALALAIGAAFALRAAVPGAEMGAPMVPGWNPALPALARDAALSGAAALLAPARPLGVLSAALAGFAALAAARRPDRARVGASVCAGLGWAALGTAPVFAYAASGLLAAGFAPPDFRAPHRLYLAAAGGAFALAAPILSSRPAVRALALGGAAALALAQGAASRENAAAWARQGAEAAACRDVYDPAAFPPGATPVFEAPVLRDCALALIARLEDEGRFGGTWGALGDDGRVTPGRLLVRPARRTQDAPVEAARFAEGRPTVRLAPAPGGGLRVARDPP